MGENSSCELKITIQNRFVPVRRITSKNFHWNGSISPLMKARGTLSDSAPYRQLPERKNLVHASMRWDRVRKMVMPTMAFDTSRRTRKPCGNAWRQPEVVLPTIQTASREPKFENSLTLYRGGCEQARFSRCDPYVHPSKKIPLKEEVPSALYDPRFGWMVHSSTLDE